MGEAGKDALRVDFDRVIKLEFCSARVSSDAGLFPYRDLDDAVEPMGEADPADTAGTGDSDGNDNNTSIERIKTLSVTPPKYPETRPMKVPHSIANATAANAATSETRAP